MAIKIRSTPFFAWKVKPEVPCRVRFYGILNIPLGVSDTDKVKLSLFRPFLLLAPDVSACMTARELWWTSQELSSAGIIITMALHAHISPGG
jgi:hypothetical protein